MARKKIIKEGFHLKFIPKGRLDDLIQIANNFLEVQDKQLALWKVIEVFSSIVERCWQYDKKFITVNQHVLRNKLGLEKGVGKLLTSLVNKRFLDIDKSKFPGSSYSYKPIYDILNVIKIPRKFLNINSDNILGGKRDFEICSKSGDTK